MHLAWITDPHLNFLRHPQACEAFGEYVAQDLETFVSHEYETDKKVGVVITGDIAECRSLTGLLLDFARGLNVAAKIPLYFVLGNHDVYGGSFAQAEQAARAAVKSGLQAGHDLYWLPDEGPIPLSNDTMLVGVDGWYDVRLGLGQASRLAMSDHHLIAEFTEELGDSGVRRPLPRAQIVTRSRVRAAVQAAKAYGKIDDAVVAGCKKVVFATHVPPFKEACWHEGKMSDPEWLPWFTSDCLGEALIEVAQEHQHVELEVLCGHTHGAGETTVLPNLVVRTGAAKYGHPAIHQIRSY